MNSAHQLALLDNYDSDILSVATGHERQILVFRSGNSRFGLPAALVCEMHFLPELAPIEEAPAAMVGLLNLRGKLLPVLDLDVIFGRSRRTRTLNQSIVVVEHRQETFALIVDEVESVMSCAPEDIGEVPQLGRGQSTQPACVAALYHGPTGVVMMLDLERLWLTARASGEHHENWSLPETGWDHTALPHGEIGFERADVERLAEAEEFRARALHLMQGARETEATTGLFAMALVILGGETFGVSLKEMREFTELRLVSPVPCCPEHILGQMNLRGDVVTLLDVRPLLNLPPRGISQGGHVLVAQYDGAPVGLLLDEVLDVVYLPQDNLTHSIQASVGAGPFLKGGAFHDGKVICLLDLERLLSESSLTVDETL